MCLVLINMSQLIWPKRFIPLFGLLENLCEFPEALDADGNIIFTKKSVSAGSSESDSLWDDIDCVHNYVTHHVMYHNDSLPETPIEQIRAFARVNGALDFLQARVPIHMMRHCLYEYFLSKDYPDLFAERMNDMEARWFWTLPAKERPDHEVTKNPHYRCRPIRQIQMDPVAQSREDCLTVVCSRSEAPAFNLKSVDTKSLQNIWPDIGDIYDKIPWYAEEPEYGGVILAGGAIVHAVHNLTVKSDYDFFIVVPPNCPDTERIERAKSILKKFDALFPVCPRGVRMMGWEKTVFQRQNITWKKYEDYNSVIKLQVILRLYETPSQVVHGFDLDGCCVYNDGKTVYAAKRAEKCFFDRYMVIDPICQSPSYNFRLVKYATRYGWDILIPGYRNMVKLDPKSSVYPYFFNMKGTSLTSLLSTVFYNNVKDESKVDDILEEISDYANFSLINIEELNSMREDKQIPCSDIEFILDNPGQQSAGFSGSFQSSSTNNYYGDYWNLVHVRGKKVHIVHGIRTSPTSLSRLAILNKTDLIHNNYISLQPTRYILGEHPRLSTHSRNRLYNIMIGL